ncbi:MAG: hypothetical protein HYT07_02750 [Candidatus Levybacteria bacterium]|nr:hypothetical protein [Candidatus Levybacteria bacterium]
MKNKSITFLSQSSDSLEKNNHIRTHTKHRNFKKVLDKPVVLFDIDYTLFDTDHFKKSYLTKHRIYEEVGNVLKSLSNIAILGIFSEGDLELQKRKLIKTAILNYFEKGNTHIVLNKLVDLKRVLGKYKNRKTFFIDDKLSILCDTKKIFPEVVAIWVKRGVYAKNQKEIAGFKPDAEVEDLKEVVKIINSKL